MGQEQFLQGRLLAQELLDAGRRQHLQQGLHGAVHLAADDVAGHLQGADPGDAGEVGDGTVEGGLDAEGGEMAHVR